MVLAIFERLKNRRREAEQRKVATWEELIQRVAGDQADESEIEASLASLGRTEDDLQSAVVLLLKRQDWQSQADELPELQQAANEIEAQQKQLAIDADREIQAVKTRQRIESDELSRQLGIIARKIHLANEAGANLHATKPPEVKAAELAHGRAVQELLQERDQISGDLAWIRNSGHKRGSNYEAGERRVVEIDAQIQKLQGTSR
jgi:hypothetical protein